MHLPLRHTLLRGFAVFALFHFFTSLWAQPGTLDSSFNPGLGADGSVLAMAVQPDGKILIGGQFLAYNDTTRRRIARLNADGTLDTGFNPGSGISGGDAEVLALAVQPDGKILIAGSFSTYNGTSRRSIARLNADGSLDTSFDPGLGVSFVSAIALQPDGKILIGGSFSTYNGTPRKSIARLNANGSLDTSFDPGSGANFGVNALAVQPDGRILIGGTFTSYNGTTRNRIARLNANGSLDTSFDPGSGMASGGVLAISMQPDGKTLIGGAFTTYNGTARNRIARLNANGSLDTSFDPGSGANLTVQSMALQPDGKTLIGGVFTAYNGTTLDRIVRLNADGSHDSNFNLGGTGANSKVSAIAVQPDGKILIAGGVSQYNGTGRGRVARLNGDPTCTAPSFTACPVNQSVNVAPNTCAAPVAYTAEASGTPAPALTYAFTGATTGSGSGTGSDSTFSKGVTNVVITASSSCTPAATCSFTVTVTDNQFPTITCPNGSPFTRNTDAGACTYTVQGAEFAPLTFDDNCPGASITNSFNNLDSLAGAGLPKGPNTITWTVTDATGLNMASCQISVTVNENQPPTVSCPVNQTVPPGSNNPCSATVGGIDAGYADNCGGAALTFALSGATSGSGNGQASGQTFLYGVTTVTYTVTDSANLTSSCAFTVTVAPVNLVFSGKIRWENDGVSGVNNATVNLTGAATGSDLSDTNGDYSISKPATTGNFTLKPTKTANKLNGLTAADATAIQQHVASAVLLPAPYKRIAADVNKSNTITTLDAILITQALLGNGSALAQIHSWRFVDAAYTFPNPGVPWGFPEQINLTGVVCDQTGVDFTGIKLGDVASGWANPANFAGPGGARLVLRAQDQVLQAGQTVVTEFRADELNDLTALQFALQFDPSALHLDSVEMLDGLPLTMENFGLYQVAGGEIRVVWSREKSVSLSEASPLFRLRFTALESGARLNEVLKLDAAEDTDLPARVYNSALAESGVELQYWEATGAGAPANGIAFQVYPSPFIDRAAVYFDLPAESEVELRVIDVAGRVLFSQKKRCAAGRQAETLALEGAAGMMVVELKTEWGSAVRKVVAVR